MSKEWHEPKAYRGLSLTIMGLQFSAFVLLLLVGISLTIIKPIYLLSVGSVVDAQTSVANELRFGVWGVCASSELTEARCFGPRLGYEDIPDEIFQAAGIPPSASTIILKAILAVLILHIVGAGLALVTFLLSFLLRSHGFSIVALITAFLTAVATSLAFAFDLALVLVAKREVRGSELANTLEVSWGNGVWMVLAGMVVTWLAVVMVAARVCYCCGIRPHRRMHHHHPSHSSHSSFNQQNRH